MRFPRSLVSEFKKRVSGFAIPQNLKLTLDWLVEREVDRREVTPSYRWSRPDSAIVRPL